MFNDEIEAWEYGPVVNTVYQKYKSQGDKPIYSSQIKNRMISEEVKEFIRSVLRKYGSYTVDTLISMTHEEGTPWKKYYQEGKKHITIPVGEIEDYFKKMRKLLNRLI